MTDPDKRYKEYATDRQWEIYLAFCETGSKLRAAEKLGISRAAVRQALKILFKKAAQAGYAPDHDMVRTSAPGFAVDRVSSYYGKEGGLTGQWVISSRQRQQLMEQLLSHIRTLGTPLKVICPGRP